MPALALQAVFLKAEEHAQAAQSDCWSICRAEADAECWHGWKNLAELVRVTWVTLTHLAWLGAPRFPGSSDTLGRHPQKSVE